MSLKLDTLPVDVIYHILSHLSGIHDIVRLRQASTLFNNVTRQLTVWKEAYAKSSVVISAPSDFSSIVDLEATLVHATQLDRNWSSQAPRYVTRRTISGFLNSSYDMTLAHDGRYLIVSFQNGVKCYDLNADDTTLNTPISEYSIQIRSGLHTQLSVDNPGCVHTAFCTRRDTVIVLKFELSKLQFELVMEIPTIFPTSFSMRLFNDYLILSTKRDAILHHIHDHSILQVPPDSYTGIIMDRPSSQQEYIVTNEHLWVIHLSNTLNYDESVFEAFPISPGCSSLVRSHAGVCPFTFVEPKLIHTGDDCATFIALIHEPVSPRSRGYPRSGMRLFQVRMCDDSLHFHIVDSALTTFTMAYNFNLTPSEASSRTGGAPTNGLLGRGAALVAFGGVNMLTCTVRENKIAISGVDLPPDLYGATDMIFDGKRGRMCISLDDSIPNIVVLDF